MKNFFLLVALSLSIHAHAQQHGLDSTFNDSGIVIAAVTGQINASSYWDHVYLQLDGKILVTGYGTGVRVVRYKTNGTQDSSFANNGMLTCSMFKFSSFASRTIINSDTNILIAGTLLNNDFGVLKIKPNGSPDSSFGLYGLARQTGGSEGVSEIALQADGKIVICGTTYDNYVAVRFHSNGNIDSSFGNNGRIVTYGGLYETQCNAVAVQNDGKILLTGRGWYNGDVAFMTIRYKTNGSIDSSFGVNGRAYWQPGTAAAHDIKLLPNGKILLSGGTTYPIAAEVLMRLESDGSLDTSFNHTGYLLVPHIGYTPLIFAFGCHFQLLTDGRIVLGGVVEDTTIDSWKHASLSRCTADGRLDSSFCINGSQVFTLSQLGSGINSLAVQQDGKIITAGFCKWGNGKSLMTLARFMPDGNVSIPEIAQTQPEVNIYPNPANTSFTIETREPISSVRLTGIDGKTYKFIDKPTHTQFTTEDLPNGTYFVLITIHGHASLAKAITIIH